MAGTTFSLAPARPLAPGDASVAILHTGDGRYLMQRRDAVPTIFYPDHWGFFGGALEPGETPLEALRRELREELAFELDPRRADRFGHVSFGVDSAGIGNVCRAYYEVRIAESTVGDLNLGEGAEMALLDGAHALHEMRLVPYDAFALWLHYYRRMLAAS